MYNRKGWTTHKLKTCGIPTSSWNACEQVLLPLHRCNRQFLPIYFLILHQEYSLLRSSHGLSACRILDRCSNGQTKTSLPWHSHNDGKSLMMDKTCLSKCYPMVYTKVSVYCMPIMIHSRRQRKNLKKIINKRRGAHHTFLFFALQPIHLICYSSYAVESL